MLFSEGAWMLERQMHNKILLHFSTCHIFPQLCSHKPLEDKPIWIKSEKHWKVCSFIGGSLVFQVTGLHQSASLKTHPFAQPTQTDLNQRVMCVRLKQQTLRDAKFRLLFLTDFLLLNNPFFLLNVLLILKRTLAAGKSVIWHKLLPNIVCEGSQTFSFFCIIKTLLNKSNSLLRG